MMNLKSEYLFLNFVSVRNLLLFFRVQYIGKIENVDIDKKEVQDTNEYIANLEKIEAYVQHV